MLLNSSVLQKLNVYQKGSLDVPPRTGRFTSSLLRRFPARVKKTKRSESCNNSNVNRKKHNSTENEKLISRQNSLLVSFARPKNSLVGYPELEVGRLDEKNVVEIEGKVREKVKPPGESSRLHIGTSLFTGLIWSREKKYEEPADPKPGTKTAVTEVSSLQPPALRRFNFPFKAFEYIKGDFVCLKKRETKK
ncbi:hypothetical protein RUM43_009430 [Polyplax serrata]|uniref:Uncharacterized protein n=1 Tax=Polyplax serrata TaxID=468196 RepID=A0AAN8PAS9_POLSC